MRRSFIYNFWFVFLIATTIFLSATNQLPIRASRLALAQIFIFILFIFDISGHLIHRTGYRNKWLTFLLIWMFFGTMIKNLTMHGYFNLIFYDEVTYFALINIILFVYLCITTIKCMSVLDVERILKLMCWLLLLQCGYCLIQMVQYDSVFYDVFLMQEKILRNRPVGTLENENMFAAYLSFILPLCFIWRKKWWNLAGILAIPFILISKSIMAITSMCAGLSVLIFLRSTIFEIKFKIFKKHFRLCFKKAFTLCLILSALFIGGLYKYKIIVYQDNILNILIKNKQVYHFDLHNCGRFQHWKESLQMTRPYSWTGIGIGRYKVAMPEFMKGQTAKIYAEAHNDHLQILCELGIIGLILYLLFILDVFKKTWQMRHNQIIQGIFAGLVAFMVNAIGNFPFHVIHLAGIGLFLLCAVEIIGGNNNA